MIKEFWLTGLSMLMVVSVSAFAAEAAPSIVLVGEVYVEDAVTAHSNAVQASTSVASLGKSANASGLDAAHDFQASVASANEANTNVNAPERGAYDTARQLAQVWNNLARAQEGMIMADYKAAIAGAAAAKAEAVVAEDAAVNAENLAANTDILAAKVDYSVGPNDKALLQKAAEKARRLANEAGASAKHAQDVALKIMDQVTLVNEAALQSNDAISKIKPYTGAVSH